MPSLMMASRSRSASPARASAWLPQTITGRLAAATRFAMSRIASGLGSTAGDSAAGFGIRSPPANRRRVCQFSQARTALSASLSPRGMLSAYQPRMICSS